MATIDLTQRKLYCPPRFLPYLEKHRIFELFHECIELLVQFRPKDHIQFLKDILPCANKKKDKQRIVFITPTHFDRETFALLLSECLGIQNITQMTLELLTKNKTARSLVKIKDMNEIVEVESCISLVEEEYPAYFPIWAEESPNVIKYEEEEEEEKEEKEEEEEVREPPPEEPCECICPCVEQFESEEKEERQKEQEEKSQKEQEEEIEEAEEEELPPYRHEKRDREKPKPIPKPKPKPKEFSPFRFPPQEPQYPPGLQGIKTVSSFSSEVKLDHSILAECEISAKGWILQDFPTSGEEAEILSSVGVIPTHALRIIVDEEEEARDQDYQATLREWKEVYRKIPVMEIRKGKRNVEELARDMCKLLSVMPHRHAPMQLRVVLIGSRGSGMTTQAQKLSQKYGLVHVEFDIVMARALEQDDEICKLYKIQLDSRPDPEVEAVLLERALLTGPCRKRGWVLTGYPKNTDQMRMLDLIATPPNRIIFIEVPPKECFVRLYYRKTDSCLGDRYKIPEILPFGLDSFDAPNVETEVKDRLFSTKKNDRKQIIHDIEYYFLQKNGLMAYYGKTASFVDGNKPAEKVFQLIEQVIINPAPAQPPRNPISIGYGVEESYKRLKKFRLASGVFFNNLLLNPPEKVARF